MRTTTDAKVRCATLPSRIGFHDFDERTDLGVNASVGSRSFFGAIALLMRSLYSAMTASQNGGLGLVRQPNTIPASSNIKGRSVSSGRRQIAGPGEHSDEAGDGQETR